MKTYHAVGIKLWKYLQQELEFKTKSEHFELPEGHRACHWVWGAS